MEIIPAIDIKHGQCVRLYQGDFNQVTVYDADPIAVAKRWVGLGARRLHVVDLDGARAGHPVNTDVIVGIVRAVEVPIQLGGGLRTEESAQAALALGVSQVILGTAAVRQPDLVARLASRYGDAIIVGVDARDGMVALEGWTEAVPLLARDLVVHMAQLGVARVIYTDIARDGTLTEPNYQATAALLWPDGPAIYASGGISQAEHLRKLAAIGAHGAIIGKALYSGDLLLEDALAALQE